MFLEIFVVLLLVSFALTYFIKYIALKKEMVDIPNERSSHTVPTPRGGGLAIVITFILGLFMFQKSIPQELFYALLLSVPMAILGLVDDIVSLSSKARLALQILFSASAVYLLGGIEINLGFFSIEGWLAEMLAVVTIVWFVNLYNFLDGIDGYAATEALFVAVGMLVFFHSHLGIAIAAAALGFLMFNWHKASIFMGDVGSTTLGFIFAVLMFHDAQYDGSIYTWLVMLSLFWFDATATLARRYLHGEKVMQAHKKHAYQRLTQSGWSHSKVVIASTVFNLIFFLLLYLSKNPLLILLVNIVSLIVVTKIIDRKKSFDV